VTSAPRAMLTRPSRTGQGASADATDRARLPIRDILLTFLPATLAAASEALAARQRLGTSRRRSRPDVPPPLGAGAAGRGPRTGPLPSVLRPLSAKFPAIHAASHARGSRHSAPAILGGIRLCRADRSNPTAIWGGRQCAWRIPGSSHRRTRR
jgi:hypothetical protein